MSDTPTTDSLCFPVGKSSLHPRTVVVAVDDARNLERQLSSALSEIQKLKKTVEFAYCEGMDDSHKWSMIKSQDELWIESMSKQIIADSNLSSKGQ